LKEEGIMPIKEIVEKLIKVKDKGFKQVRECDKPFEELRIANVNHLIKVYSKKKHK
jgi:hypothetical protein